MNLHDLSPAPGAKRKRRRVGRGIGSGRGKTSGRGHKGQNSRSGGGVRRGFEGGQMPLYMRVPKFGFVNKFRRDYATVNVGELNRFPADAEIDPDALVASGLIKLPKQGESHFGGSAGIKVLGGGELEHALVVKAHAFTASAKAKIEAAGGRAEVI